MAKNSATFDNPEYVIGVGAKPNHYTVAKFRPGDSGAPAVVYEVVFNPDTGYGRCNCPAAAYRNTGSADKHCKMVADWLKTQ